MRLAMIAVREDTIFGPQQAFIAFPEKQKQGAMLVK